jgi:hypothetical protein
LLKRQAIDSSLTIFGVELYKLFKDSRTATEVSERRARNTQLWLEDAALAVVEDDEDDGNGDDNDKNLIEV